MSIKAAFLLSLLLASGLETMDARRINREKSNKVKQGLRIDKAEEVVATEQEAKEEARATKVEAEAAEEAVADAAAEATALAEVQATAEADCEKCDPEFNCRGPDQAFCLLHCRKEGSNPGSCITVLPARDLRDLEVKELRILCLAYARMLENREIAKQTGKECRDEEEAELIVKVQAIEQRVFEANAVAKGIPKRLLDGTFPNADDTGVFISSTDQIPPVDPDARGELIYLEAAIPINEGLGIDTGKVNVYHSGIGVAFGGDRLNLTVQWYAKEGLGSAIFRSADGIWQNKAVLVLSPLIAQDYWTKQTKVADITGAMWNKHAEFLASYAKKHPAYQLWRVVLAGDVLIPESICDSFSEASLQKFQELGAEMDLARSPLKRNYVTLVVKEKPTLVKMDDPTKAEEVLRFYQRVHKKMKSKVLTIGRLAASYVKGLFMKNNDRVGFIGSPLSGGVFQVVVEGQRGSPLKLDYADIVIA